MHGKSNGSCPLLYIPHAGLHLHLKIFPSKIHSDHDPISGIVSSSFDEIEFFLSNNILDLSISSHFFGSYEYHRFKSFIATDYTPRKATYQAHT